jgi:hypothetical protein
LGNLAGAADVQSRTCGRFDAFFAASFLRNPLPFLLVNFPEARSTYMRGEPGAVEGMLREFGVSEDDVASASRTAIVVSKSFSDRSACARAGGGKEPS